MKTLLAIDQITDPDKRVKAFADAYLDYVNNYLTAAKFAEDYGCEETQARIFIERGRACQELRAAAFAISGGHKKRTARVCA